MIRVDRSGKVTQGYLSILDELPIVNLAAENLPGLVSNPGTDYLSLSGCKLKSHPTRY
jgi:alpha-aminoadipic semialdehyde synthase